MLARVTVYEVEFDGGEEAMNTPLLYSPGVIKKKNFTTSDIFYSVELV